MKKLLQWISTLLLFLAVLSACSPFSLVDGNSPIGLSDVNIQASENLPVAYHDVPTSQPATAFDLQADLINVYQQANPSVVYILTGTGSGSGFVYDQQGHIVTNNHVVNPTGQVSSRFEIVFANGDRQQAFLVGADTDSDLAVLQVEALPAGISPLPLADMAAIQVGQIVVAIGNPFGEQGSMSMGIVSGVGRSLPAQRSANFQGSYSLPEAIQTDAPINPGNSGGPLLNLDGQLIGVNSAIASETGTNSGVGFAIPVSAVYKIVPSLISDGKYTYSYMGVSFDNEISLSEQGIYGISQTRGAYVVTVSPGSPADRAGLIPADSNNASGGDLIIAIDGVPIDDFAGLNSYLVFHTSPGQTVELTVIRRGEQISLPLTLGARP